MSWSVAQRVLSRFRALRLVKQRLADFLVKALRFAAAGRAVRLAPLFQQALDIFVELLLLADADLSLAQGADWVPVQPSLDALNMENMLDIAVQD